MLVAAPALLPFLSSRSRAATNNVGAALSSRVAATRCMTYESELVPAMMQLFDRLDIGKLVNGKTVGIKINMTGSPTDRLGYIPLEDTVYSNPRVIGATVHLLGRAGARRIRVLEGAFNTGDPLEEFMLQAGWEPLDILNAAPRVEMENTNIAGPTGRYHRFTVPGGGHIFPAFDLNHSYADCDVFVSLAKLKEHATAGVTLTMKNCFGSTPISIYGESAGVDEPNESPRGGRGMFHAGHRQPSRSAPGEIRPPINHDGGYRVPRIVADIVAARPIDLAIIDGVKSLAGGEGPWIDGVSAVHPGVLIAGLNPVSTDAVAMSIMGFDPMGDRGTPPFETSDSTLRLAEELGVGTRDLNRIEVVGPPIDQLGFDYAGPRKLRRARHRRTYDHG